MKLIITSILFTISQSNRLLQSSACETIRCAGPCFDNPYTNTPRCCPDDATCSSNDYQDTTMVVCADGNTYDNKCYGYCAGNQPKDCKSICECTPGNNDCSYGYECLETPIGFAGCDEKIGNSCFGFCVSKGKVCGGYVGLFNCEENEQCFYTEIFSDGRGIGYCGSLPNKCKNLPVKIPVGCTKDGKICPDGTTVGRVPPNCEFAPCPITTTREPNYCGGYDNCQWFFDGCNECDCGGDGLGWPLRCSEEVCDQTTLGKTYCIECADGYELNKLQKCIKSKPKCGGFKNCAVYNDGCNDCICGLMEDACGSKFCSPEWLHMSYCIGCKYGYELINYECQKIMTTTGQPATPHICVDGTECTTGEICYDRMNGPICCDPMEDICRAVSTCGGIMGGICKPDYECVNDPNIECVYGTDPDCTGVCLWVKPNIVATTCPLSAPKPGDTCNFDGSCYWDKEYCCGKTYDSFACDCRDGQFWCRYTDACLGAPEKCGTTTQEPITPPKPYTKCGGFKNCARYNDGCNHCTCGLNGDACGSKFCPEDMKSEPQCIECQYGYELKYNGKCVKTPIPEENKCCNQMNRPYKSCACCPDGTWTCGGMDKIGYSCGNDLLFPGDQFGKICETENTLTLYPGGSLRGCLTLTCTALDSCCPDGNGGVKCCRVDTPVTPPNNDKISCERLSDCDVINGYRCRPDPLCKGNGGTYKSCDDQKVCLITDGKCDSDLDCEMGYKCVSVTDTVGFCVKYE